MNEKPLINLVQAKIIAELEDIIGKSLPYVDKIEWETIGVQVEGDNVIGLGLYQCGLTTLPESFGDLKSLKYLNLDNNQLAVLSESFGNLKSLQILYINDNKLKTLPKSFGQLESLRDLRLSNNKLKTIPEPIL